MRGADGVAVPRLAVDLLAWMLGDRVVAADRNDAARREADEHLQYRSVRTCYVDSYVISLSTPYETIKAGLTRPNRPIVYGLSSLSH